MTGVAPCPVCAAPAPVHALTGQSDYCSIDCYRASQVISRPEIPSRHDTVTTPCPLCRTSFAPTGRQRYCSDACRAAAYRRRRDNTKAPVTLPKDQPRRPITVYECGTCGTRAAGNQYCDDCQTFMFRVGTGGTCPNCDEPVTVAELLGREEAT